MYNDGEVMERIKHFKTNYDTLKDQNEVIARKSAKQVI